MEALVKDSLKLGFGLMRLPRLESGEIDVEQFITVKGFKAKGKRLTTYQIESITELEPTRFPESQESEESEDYTDDEDLDPDAGKSEQEVIDEITGQTRLFSDDDF